MKQQTVDKIRSYIIDTSGILFITLIPINGILVVFGEQINMMLLFMVVSGFTFFILFSNKSWSESWHRHNHDYIAMYEYERSCSK